MATIKQFEDLEVWQKSREQSKIIWELTKDGSLRHDFGLKNQINKSSGSVMDNIAEGFGRKGNIEFVNFLTYSAGSNDEVRSQIHRMKDRSHIDESMYELLLKNSIDLGVRINNFVSYLNNSNYRGIKFKR